MRGPRKFARVPLERQDGIKKKEGREGGGRGEGDRGEEKGKGGVGRRKECRFTARLSRIAVVKIARIVGQSLLQNLGARIVPRPNMQTSRSVSPIFIAFTAPLACVPCQFFF